MNNLFTKSILSAAISLILSSCGGTGDVEGNGGGSGGGGGVAGIGGSGFVSSGSISGFGSVFVNGVKFETDNATFDVDGASGTQDDLAIGMVVRVDGTINADGITGDATHISFDDELQGPISAINNIGNDGVSRSITVLGVNAIIDSSSTSFDVSDDLPSNTVFDFNNIAVNNNVEISGFFDSNGDIQVTRIELKDIVFDSNSEVEVEGNISGLSGTTFNLGGLVVDASSAELADLPNGLIDGQLVEVKGSLSVDLTTILATKVEAEDNSVDDSDEFEIEGLVTDYVSDSDFKVNGILVDASNAEREPATLVIENDARIQVEGAIVDNKLIATDIELEGGSVEVKALVTTVNAAENTFTVRPVSGQPDITVTISSGTQLEDDVNDIEPFTLNNLVQGSFVEVQGFENGSGGIAATEIDVKEADDIVVEGNATAATGSAATGGTITVLGVTFDFDVSTDFENNDDSTMTAVEIDALIGAISTTTPQFVKIKDNEPADGIADKIEID